MYNDKILNSVQIWLPGFSAMYHVWIGRACAFPPSKRSGPLSRHSAFRTRPYDLRSTRLSISLMSTAQPVAEGPPLCRRTRPSYSWRFPISVVYLSRWLSWQSFVLSIPLQDGLWLLCCLRPLSCTLAFSRPFRARQYQSSPVPRGRVRATRSLPVIRRVFRGRTLTDV